ncbi:MAG: radical SAM family heme chaperone HemW [Clostridiales bacterium]|nr:radical SAM family heme chaperone HemW [Clostridiales bacterium]
MLLQLYLHFPFCKRKCLYCDFTSCQATEVQMAEYCLVLQDEIRRAAARYPDARVTTVFLGGGTPSVVPAAMMRQVLRALRSSFRFAQDVEFTSEANPGTLTQPWLEAVMEGGLNRLSLGVQAAQDELLARIGRIHPFAQAVDSIRLVKQMGVSNINADVMYGLPGQTQTEYLETLDRVCDTGVTHLSAYSLILEEGTPLCAQVEAGEITVPDDDACAEMTQRGIELLEKAGYHQYEISNYARDGFVCRHNIGYWQGAWYLGMGVAAHSMLPPDAAEAAQGAVRVRAANTDHLSDYLKGAWERQERSLIKADEAMFETMMLGLRMTQGVSEAHFAAMHGMPMEQRYQAQLAGLIADGLAKWQGEGAERRFALTPRGLLLQNEALLRLMD